MSFKLFENLRRDKSPRVTLTKKGVFLFNNPFCKKYKVFEYKYATLYFNSEKLQMGIIFSTEKEKGSCKISNKSIMVKSLLNAYKLTHLLKNISYYYPIYNATEKMIIINLNKKKD